MTASPRLPIHPIIQQIVDRCHVGESNRYVIRYVIECLDKGYQSWLTMTRKDRREVMRQIIHAHAENLKVYRHVMGGIA